MYPQPPARKFTRAERMAMIDLAAPDSLARMTIMFQCIVSEPAMLDLDDEIDKAMADGTFFDHEFDSDEAIGGDSE